MFWFGKKKHYLIDSGILDGKTDIHCHILPGVDDGSPNERSSLELLDYMENDLGFGTLWFTPHVMTDLGNSVEKLRARFNEFLPKYKGDMDIHLSSEYMIDSNFESYFERGIMPLGKEHLLVETSYFHSPNHFEEILLHIWQSGLCPLIAHPERYMYMEMNDYHALKGKGYHFQLNIMSLTGYYGARPKLYAEKLLAEKFYDYVGSDLHHLERYQSMLENLKLETKQLDLIEELLENNAHV